MLPTTQPPSRPAAQPPSRPAVRPPAVRALPHPHRLDELTLCLLREQIFITSSLRPEDIKARGGEDRLKERVQKVLAGIHKKLDLDPRMRR
jgi:hypothetical protein